MAATTSPINTPEKPCGAVDMQYDVNSSATLYPGAMANLNASGELVDAGDTASELCAGMVISYNATTKKAVVRRGVAKFAINSTDLAKAQIFTKATVKDNQTLSKASVTSNDVVAGTVIGIDSDGAWIDFRFQ